MTDLTQLSNDIDWILLTCKFQGALLIIGSVATGCLALYVANLRTLGLHQELADARMKVSEKHMEFLEQLKHDYGPKERDYVSTEAIQEWERRWEKLSKEIQIYFRSTEFNNHFKAHLQPTMKQIENLAWQCLDLTKREGDESAEQLEYLKKQLKASEENLRKLISSLQVAVPDNKTELWEKYYDSINITPPRPRFKLWLLGFLTTLAVVIYIYPAELGPCAEYLSKKANHSELVVSDPGCLFESLTD